MSEPVSTLLDWAKEHLPDLVFTEFQESSLTHTSLPDLNMITPWNPPPAKLSEWTLVNEVIDAYRKWKDEEHG